MIISDEIRTYLYVNLFGGMITDNQFIINSDQTSLYKYSAAPDVAAESAGETDLGE